MKGTASLTHNASFRDPKGFVFIREGTILRQVNVDAKKDYDQLMNSGLYKALVEKKWLVAHKESKLKPVQPKQAYKILAPAKISFISYPYEWSFSQLKDAALLTLKIQQLALTFGMTLKDASAYNIQFERGKPIFIDTLSFEIYEPGKPWQAYKQFCQHFLAPLAVMAKTDVDLGLLLRDYIDGIPLSLAAKLLPRRSKLQAGLLIHIYMHARSQKGHAKTAAAPKRKVSQQALIGIVASLQNTIKKLNLRQSGTEWEKYYSFTNYAESSFKTKKKLVHDLVVKSKAAVALDLGSNNGLFSREAAKVCGYVISVDIDPLAVEANYVLAKQDKDTALLPLRIDLNNPSPALGWAHIERDSFALRCETIDVVLALALIHHLAISNNLPLERIANYVSSLAPKLIIEFVPKEDSQVKVLLATREDIFPDYTYDGFEAAFLRYYRITSKVAVKGTKRTLYLMEKKDAR